MRLDWVQLFSNPIEISAVHVVLCLFVSAVALIFFNDWYVVMKNCRKLSSVEELEAWFQLMNSRESTLHWRRR